MSDIVERLQSGILSRVNDVAAEAAEEIVRLRAYRDWVRASYVIECGARIAAEAECDRLRDALRKIDDTLTNMQPVIANGLLNREQLGYVDRYVDPAIQTARAALGDTP